MTQHIMFPHSICILNVLQIHVPCGPKYGAPKPWCHSTFPQQWRLKTEPRHWDIMFSARLLRPASDRTTHPVIRYAHVPLQTMLIECLVAFGAAIARQSVLQFANIGVTVDVQKCSRNNISIKPCCPKNCTIILDHRTCKKSCLLLLWRLELIIVSQESMAEPSAHWQMLKVFWYVRAAERKGTAETNRAKI